MFGKRAQVTGPVITYYELWRQRHQNIFSALKMVSPPPPPKYMANDAFSKIPRRGDSKKSHFHFFPEFCVRATSGAWGSASVGFWGGGGGGVN